MQTYHIGCLIEGIERNILHPQARFLCGAAPEGVIIDHLGIERLEPPGHLLANIAQPHEADGFAHQLIDIDRARDALMPAPTSDILMEGSQLLIHRQDEHERVLCYRYRVRTTV